MKTRHKGVFWSAKSRFLRTDNLYGRWGGEEFVELEQLGNRLRLLVEKSYIIHDNEKLHVTISIGATVAKDKDTMNSLMKRADHLMYKSKAAGKNCLTIG